jgi:hypothetical protein
MNLIGEEQLALALQDAIAVSQEFVGDPVARLALLGLDAEGLIAVLEERYGAYLENLRAEAPTLTLTDDEEVAVMIGFMRAFVEGLFTMEKLAKT